MLCGYLFLGVFLFVFFDVFLFFKNFIFRVVLFSCSFNLDDVYFVSLVDVNIGSYFVVILDLEVFSYFCEIL